MSENENEPVSVDPGDLSEVCQAAAAWASYLRKDRDNAEATADRIDAAIHRLREQSYDDREQWEAYMNEPQHPGDDSAMTPVPPATDEELTSGSAWNQRGRERGA